MSGSVVAAHMMMPPGPTPTSPGSLCGEATAADAACDYRAACGEEAANVSRYVAEAGRNLDAGPLEAVEVAARAAEMSLARCEEAACWANAWAATAYARLRMNLGTEADWLRACAAAAEADSIQAAAVVEARAAWWARQRARVFVPPCTGEEVPGVSVD